MNYSDLVQCYVCKDIHLRGKTLILENSKGMFRLCMMCFGEYQKKKEMDNFKEAKNNTKLYNLKDTDGFDLIDRRRKFLKEIMNGRT